MKLSFAPRIVRKSLFSALILGCLGTGAAFAATLPDETQTSNLNVTVAAQATLVVPANIAFTVNSVAAGATSSSQTVTASDIVLNNLDGLRISLKANTAAFSKPTGASLSPYVAGDISWNAATWSNGTGAAGTLLVSYLPLVTTADNALTSSTTGLVFTLGSRTAADIDRAGSYVMVVTYKMEAI